MISIIIPTYNEAESIENLIKYLLLHSSNSINEIIVSDGGSSDDTVSIAKKAGAIVVRSTRGGRAIQMNEGAAIATGEILYFVHADSLPPATFASDIMKGVARGFALGRYKTRFDSSSMLLKFNAFFTRFDWFMCMGGDQTLYVTNELFSELSGFRADMQIMEEYEFCMRARKHASYLIMRGYTKVSARKYETNGWLRVQLANAKAIKLYRSGASQQEIVKTYKTALNYRENAF